MSTLTINNTEKTIQTCNRYQFGYAGVNPRDIGVVDFINCDNVVTQTTLTWDESGGNYYNIEICAKEILNINSFVINEGMIGPCGDVPVCHVYSVTVNGNSGDDVTIYYTDCEGVVRETTSYASGGTLNVPITASACARVGTATSSRGVLTDEGPCN